MWQTHLVDGWKMRCSCKGWWCAKCLATNKQVALDNYLLWLWLDKQTLQDNIKLVHSLCNKVDDYTIYEYLIWEIDEVKLEEEKKEYKPKSFLESKSIYSSTPSWDWINPNKQCVYKKPGIWERCIYCNTIKKFATWTCANYKEKEN